MIRIDTGTQELVVTTTDGQSRSYSVSTSKHGTGEREGSLMTPRGRHQIHAKFGTGSPIGSAFVAREATGEIYSEELRHANPDRDWILTRILWLEGLEPGLNRDGEVDTLSRYIYIHGMPDSEPCGTPGSIGCIRMRNTDIVELYDLVDVGTEVVIE